MKYAVRAAVTLGFAVAMAVMSLPSKASACSCVPPEPPAAAFEGATSVFAGEVTNIEKPLFSRGSADPVRVTLRLQTIWKGEVLPEVTLRTSESSASCGYPFAEGEEYVVYASGPADDLSAHLCGRTAPLANAAEDLAFFEGRPTLTFGPGEGGAAAERRFLSWIPMVATVIAASGLAVVLMRRGRTS